MARAVKTTKAAKPAQPTAKAKPAVKPQAVAKAGKPSVVPASRAAPRGPAMPMPKVSKDELRAQVAKLEGANAALKAKGREASRAAKEAGRRIAELEAEVARLQGQAVRQAVPAKAATAEGKRPGRQPRKRGIDPGDAVPPGAAVLHPEPLDAEAKAARDALEEHLSGE